MFQLKTVKVFAAAEKYKLKSFTICGSLEILFYIMAELSYPELEKIDCCLKSGKSKWIEEIVRKQVFSLRFLLNIDINSISF